jgi:plasmid stability protein
MANLTIKNIPEDLYDQLRRKAAEDRRSLNGEAIFLLEQAVRERPREVYGVLRELEELHTRMDLPYVTDEDLQKAKEEGRL